MQQDFLYAERYHSRLLEKFYIQDFSNIRDFLVFTEIDYLSIIWHKANFQFYTYSRQLKLIVFIKNFLNSHTNLETRLHYQTLPTIYYNLSRCH